MLKLSNIKKTYKTPGSENETIVLRDINLTVAPGETVAIVGPSGSGKSTLLNLIGALDKPTAGTILYDQQDITALSDRESAIFRSRQIGFVFQQHHLLPQCTVMENVLLPTLVTEDSGQRDLAVQLLETVGLSDHLSHLPSQLSGGEKQRVAVVRALINSPNLILADEPTGSLDQKNSENLGKLLLLLNKDRNLSLIVVTHSLSLAANMNTLYQLGDGCLSRSS